MAISDAQKLDYLWKKIGYGVAKTDTNDNKRASNEAIASPTIIRADKIWSSSDLIPTLIPTANSSVVAVYSDSLSTTVECVEDTTSQTNRTWKTNLTNWIPPEFGATYQVKVYVDDAGQSDPMTGGTQLFATGSGNDDEWYFDYSAGLLHFIGTNVPSPLTSSKNVYISGARYIGGFGLSSEEATGAFDSLQLDNPLETQYGGTGLTGFVNNGVFFASNTSTISFATGTSGQVFQIAANSTPTFEDLDGGTF
jgi:hypothetical protein